MSLSRLCVEVRQITASEDLVNAFVTYLLSNFSLQLITHSGLPLQQHCGLPEPGQLRQNIQLDDIQHRLAGPQPRHPLQPRQDPEGKQVCSDLQHDFIL